MIDDPTKKEKQKEIDKAEDKVLNPGTHIKACTFMDHEIDLRPLPISYTKRINNKLAKLQDTYAAAAREGSDAKTSEILKNFDVETMDGLISATSIILKFYNIDIPVSEIEEKSNTEELLMLARLQLAINGENDFLLQPLRTITVISLAASRAMAQLRNSLSTLPSAKPGASASPTSSTNTPTDN